MSDIVSDLEKDQDGNIKTCPVVGWTTGTAAGIGVLLVIQYADSEEALLTRQPKQVQLVLTPQQGIELAARLTTLAEHLQKPVSPNTKLN